jgi:hypothetical protein
MTAPVGAPVGVAFGAALISLAAGEALLLRNGWDAGGGSGVAASLTLFLEPSTTSAVRRVLGGHVERPALTGIIPADAEESEVNAISVRSL